jgi:hypothetical protein
MQRLAIGGDVTIGIVTYSGWGWEVRAAMSMARLWRDQGKVRQAREPYGSVGAADGHV